jgi:hypothetical protein
LFVGDASYDSRNYLGAGDVDFVPTKLIDTLYLETASDDWFADFNDDGLAEMFVAACRCAPSRCRTLVSKIVGYDSPVTVKERPRSVLWLTRTMDSTSSKRVSTLVSSGRRRSAGFRGRLDDAAAKKR